MYVEIGTEAVQFPEKEYINGIFLAVFGTTNRTVSYFKSISTLTQNWPTNVQRLYQKLFLHESV
jgi:hypothetical protein